MNLVDKTVLNILAKSSEAFWLLISSIVMVRHFPKAEYGTFLQIILIANTMTMFTFLGLPQSIFYFFPRAVNRGKFVIRNMLLSLCIALIASLIVYNFKHELANWLSNPLLVEYGWVAPLLLLLRAPSSLREPMLISHGSLILACAASKASNQQQGYNRHGLHRVMCTAHAPIASLDFHLTFSAGDKLGN